MPQKNKKLIWERAQPGYRVENERKEMTKKLTRPVSITLPVDIWQRLRKEAKRRNLRMYDFVPAVLETGLRRVVRGRIRKDGKK